MAQSNPKPLPTQTLNPSCVVTVPLQGEIALLPWAEMEGLTEESDVIRDQLVALNQAGYLTINSQPQVNGEKSTDPKHGWGGAGG